MTIYLDVSAAVNSRAGLGRYTRSLADALITELEIPPTLFYNRTSEASVPPNWHALPQRAFRMGYKPWRMIVWQGQLLRMDFSKLVPGAAIFHATEHLLPPLRDVPTVLTIHDLIFKLFPEHHKKLNYYFLNAAVPLFVRRADAIIAVSQATKNDLMRHYGTPDNKITVVHEAAAPHFRVVPNSEVARVRAKYDLPERFLLSVGTIEPRKNLTRLVEALARLRKGDRHLQLVVVGSKGWMFDEFFAKIEELGMQGAVRMLGFVPDEDLPAVFRAATVYVMASVYEGAGLPLLEAMACGVPVVGSSSGAIPDVIGDAGLVFPESDRDHLAQHLRRLLDDPALRRDLAERGRARVLARFTQQQVAEQTVAVYRALLGQTTSGH